MKTVITIEAHDLAGLLDLVEERRNLIARIIADDASEGKNTRLTVIGEYDRLNRIQRALIKSEDVD